MDDSSSRQSPAWPVSPSFPADLFRGAATYYSRYRPAYPHSMLEDLRSRAVLSGDGRLLDLACGTGEVALPMSPYFREVWAIDLENEMIEVGKRKGERSGVRNVRWMVGRAEEVAAPAGGFELITAGNAFHRLDRPLVARRALGWMPIGGCLAILGSSSLWSGTAPWLRVAVDVVNRWTGHQSRAGSSPASSDTTQPRQTHEGVLGDAGFREVREFRFPNRHVWTLESLIGYVYSTSIGVKIVRAERQGGFEADLRKEMLAWDNSGCYEEAIEFYSILARKPTVTS